jgi:hypothetical protein
MNKPKRTINRDSVFRDVGPLRNRDTADTGEESKSPAQGLPVEETRTHQTAIWLGDDENTWLDDQCRSIQRGGWRGITRSALIRALIRAAGAQHVDLSGVTGEAEIAERLSSKNH